MKNNSIIYLASPYSAPTKDQMNVRFRTINSVAAKLLILGKHIIAPISMSHAIVELQDINKRVRLPSGWGFWQGPDKALIEVSDQLWVADLYGWEDSEGVTAEIKYAKELDLPCYLLDTARLMNEDLIIRTKL